MLLSYCNLFFPPLGWGGVGGGVHGWVVDTAGHGGGSLPQGLGSWLTVGLFWAPDLHLRQMLLIYSFFLQIVSLLARGTLHENVHNMG